MSSLGVNTSEQHRIIIGYTTVYIIRSWLAEKLPTVCSVAPRVAPSDPKTKLFRAMCCT